MNLEVKLELEGEAPNKPKKIFFFTPEHVSPLSYQYIPLFQHCQM